MISPSEAYWEKQIRHQNITAARFEQILEMHPRHLNHDLFNDRQQYAFFFDVLIQACCCDRKAPPHCFCRNTYEKMFKIPQVSKMLLRRKVSTKRRKVGKESP